MLTFMTLGTRSGPGLTQAPYYVIVVTLERKNSPSYQMLGSDYRCI